MINNHDGYDTKNDLPYKLLKFCGKNDPPTGIMSDIFSNAPPPPLTPGEIFEYWKF